MKKAVMMFVLLAVAGAMAQKPKESVAVYMAGTEPVAVKGAYKVLGAELAKSLAKSGNYTAVDRTPEVIKVLSAADIFNKDGAIDVDKAKRAGKQLGVQMMCVAEITEVMKSYFLEARLVNVETAEISNVATAHGNMTAAADVMRNAQAIATELTGGKVKLADFSFREIEANPDKAIREYTKAIRQEPDNAEYYFKRGVAYYYKNEYDIAIADYTDAIRLAPKEALYYFARGMVYDVGKKDYNKALADYNETIRLNPDFVDAYNNRGVGYKDKKDYDRAIADFNEAIRRDPDYASAYLNRGTIYYDKEDYDRAISDYNQAIRVDPNFATAYRNRGFAYRSKGDDDRAIADWETVLRINPNDSSARIYIEGARRRAQPAENVPSELTDAIRQNPNNAEAYYDRGDYYQMVQPLDDYDAALAELALADFNHAIRLNPKEAKYYSSRAGVYMGKKDYDKALADMNEAIRLNPQEAEYYSSRANVYMGKKDYDKALADMNDAVRLNPAGKVYIHKRGSVYLAKQDYNRAVADYEAANINQPWARQELEEARRQAQSQRGQSAVQPQPVQQAATPSAPPPAPVSPPNPELEQMIANYEKFLGQCAASTSNRCAEVIYTLGALYYDKAKATTARADYRKSTDMFWRLSREYPKFEKLPNAFGVMGDAYLSAGHSDSAIIVLTQTVTRFPKSKYVPSTYLRLGEIAFAANDFGKAYGYFKKVNSEKLVGVGLGDERIGTFYYRFGASAYHTGDYKQAIDNLNTYVRRCDINAIKTKEFYDKASEYLRLAKQKK